MKEYKVKIQATIPQFLGLTTRTFNGVDIVEAKSAKEAIEIATKKMKHEMIVHDLEDEDVTITVTDVEAL